MDSGLLSTLQPDQTTISWFLSSPNGTPVTGTGLVLAYSGTGKTKLTKQKEQNASSFKAPPRLGAERTFECSEPVPGACNMEFNLDTDPNVHLHYNLYDTTIRFAPANLGAQR